MCNTPATLRTVSKAGPNKGRQFYCCPKPMGQGCNFFKWADETDNRSTNNGNDGDDDDDDPADDDGWGGRGGGRSILNTSATFKGASNWKKNSGGKAKGRTKSTTRQVPYQKPRGKRKCGICGQEGHTRKNCPNS
ncbi:DNA topoisomerase 3-alpha-like [Agrilus planipennis]|nr:DNA topoisomerase 3-alpha-like [Agrilus planipennis]